MVNKQRFVVNDTKHRQKIYILEYYLLLPTLLMLSDKEILVSEMSTNKLNFYFCFLKINRDAQCSTLLFYVQFQ